ncbi:MAG: hypothetical protein ACRAVC_15775 [Trichormus sp.]
MGGRGVGGRGSRGSRGGRGRQGRQGGNIYFNAQCPMPQTLIYLPN